MDGTTFLELKEDDVKDIVKQLGLVKKVMRIQKSWLLETDTDAVSIS